MVARRLAIAAVASLVVATPAAAKTTSPQAALLKEINRVRAAHGLRPLALDPRLGRAALAHSRSMAASGVFAHGDLRSRLRRFRVRDAVVGEYLAWGSGDFSSPTGIVEAWLRSPEHRANLLRPGFRRVGVGELIARFQGVAGASVVTADFAGL
jgi:uncharacterized protein YkwD